MVLAESYIKPHEASSQGDDAEAKEPDGHSRGCESPSKRMGIPMETSEASSEGEAAARPELSSNSPVQLKAAAHHKDSELEPAADFSEDPSKYRTSEAEPVPGKCYKPRFGCPLVVFWDFSC